MYKRMMAYTQKYKLRYRMIVTNICIAVLPILLLGLMGYFSYINVMKHNALDNIDQFVTQTNNRFDEYFSRVDQLSKSIFYNRNVQKIMVENKTWQESDELLRNLNAYMSLDPTIKAVGMINVHDFRIVSTGQLMTSEMMAYISDQKNENRVTSRMKISTPLDSKDREKVLLVYRQIKSIQQNSYLQSLYIGVMQLDTKWIQQILQEGNMGNKAIFYIVNENGGLIGSSTKELDNSRIQSLIQTHQDHQVSDIRVDDVEYWYQSIPIHGLDWKLVALVNKDKLLEKAQVIPYALIVVIAVMMLIVVLVAVSFNIRLTHPITKMADAFDSAARGDLDAKLRFGYKNEITVIQDHYNNMLDEIKKLTDNLLHSQQQLHETKMDKQLFQLNGLQSQINAHFLYNVLHSIRGMSLSNAKREVATAIDHLVSYFRYITRTDEYVLLFKELEHLETYISIQKIRFGERLQFKFSMDDALKGQSIVKLILQPLVENALYHGLEGKSGRWIIKIRASTTDNDEFLIKVMDNGTGMSSEKVESLHSRLSGQPSPAASDSTFSQGIGLVNIHKRIQIYYGESYGLTIKSWKNRGTVVTVRVPLKFKEDTHV
jgi:two-component system, sensor histidine kinase YesM